MLFSFYFCVFLWLLLFGSFVFNMKHIFFEKKLLDSMYDVMIHDEFTRFMKTLFPSKIRHVYVYAFYVITNMITVNILYAAHTFVYLVIEEKIWQTIHLFDQFTFDC